METEKTELNTSVMPIDAATRRSNVVRTLTANDIIFWGADAFILVALALFVVDHIVGATILNVGVAYMIHRVTGAISSLAIGRYFDRHKGYLDEVLGLSLACLAAGFAYVLLSFSTEVWQLYVIMMFLGLFATVNLTSWRILFYGHILKSSFGATLGTYQMLFSLGIGLFMALGGFVGERYGYDRVLLLGGLMMIIGSALPMLIRNYFVKK